MVLLSDRHSHTADELHLFQPEETKNVRKKWWIYMSIITTIHANNLLESSE